MCCSTFMRKRRRSKSHEVMGGGGEPMPSATLVTTRTVPRSERHQYPKSDFSLSLKYFTSLSQSLFVTAVSDDHSWISVSVLRSDKLTIESGGKMDVAFLPQVSEVTTVITLPPSPWLFFFNSPKSWWCNAITGTTMSVSCSVEEGCYFY